MHLPLARFLTLMRRRGRRRDSFSAERSKIELLSHLQSAGSVRDFGGLWGVDGQYLETAVEHLGCSFASMLDTLAPSPQWLQRMERIRDQFNCEVEYIQADFSDDSVMNSLRPVEVSILFDVLLHQVEPVRTIRTVAAKTTRTICVAQPVLRDSLFRLPNAAVNLQFYPAKLKRRIRGRYRGWPDEFEADRFDPGHWIWGQTVSYLNSVLQGFGWQVEKSFSQPISRYLDFAFLKYRAPGLK